jgi:hypothetical protein
VADTLAVLPSPRAGFRRLGERRPLLAPWLLVSLPSMASSLLVVSIAQRASVHLLSGMDDPELVHSVAHQLQAMKLLTVVAAPAVVWLRWCGTALLLWAMAAFVVREAPFRTILCVVACAGLPDVLARGVDLTVAWLEGPEVTPDLLPIATSASSLAALLPGAHGPWAVALLDRLTPFSLWSGALWVIGLRETLHASARRALAIALPTWAALAVGGAAVAVLRGSLASLAPGLAG